jgi:hypothetical protein
VPRKPGTPRTVPDSMRCLNCEAEVDDGVEEFCGECTELALGELRHHRDQQVFRWPGTRIGVLFIGGRLAAVVGASAHEEGPATVSITARVDAAALRALRRRTVDQGRLLQGSST